MKAKDVTVGMKLKVAYRDLQKLYATHPNQTTVVKVLKVSMPQMYVHIETDKGWLNPVSRNRVFEAVGVADDSPMQSLPKASQVKGFSVD